MSTFLEQARAGTVSVDDVESFVARWHEGQGESSLREFLGLTHEEYGRWLREPGALKEIIGPDEAQRALRRA